MAENQHYVCPRKFKFFRIFVYGCSTKLAIPQKLTKCFVEENLRLVTLLSPLGKSWNVRIGGDSKGLHFAEGWERFAAAHRLSIGDLVVFKYVGGIVLVVTIFDTSACEKEYNVRNGVPGDDHVHDRGENSEKQTECFKGETSTPPSSGQRTPSGIEQESDKDQEQVSARKEVEKSVHKTKEETKQMCKRESRFEITISPKLKYAVRIPAKLTRSNDLSSIHEMVLRDPDGRAWHVNLLHCRQPGSGHECWFLLSAGWRDFRIGNELKEGDVCVFELKKKNEMLVQIHRSCGDGSSRSKCPRPQQAVQLKQAATPQQKGSPSKVTHASKPAEPTQFRSTIVPSSASKPAEPTQFRSTIVPSNISKRGIMTIPKAFLSLVNLYAVKEVVLIDPNSRRWPVKMYHSRTRVRCCIGNGDWAGFCDGNDLKVGDVCVFSFEYRGREATFQVEVIRTKIAR